MEGKILLGHVRGYGDKPGAERAQIRRILQSECKALRTHIRRANTTEHLVARQSAEVTKMSKTKPLPPRSSLAKRLD